MMPAFTSQCQTTAHIHTNRCKQTRPDSTRTDHTPDQTHSKHDMELHTDQTQITTQTALRVEGGGEGIENTEIHITCQRRRGGNKR